MVMIASDRHYSFDEDIDTVWKAMSSVEQFRIWWPWLRQLEARELAAGEVWECMIQPPLPYFLRVTVTLREVEAPRLVVAEVSGDISGSARLELSRAGQGCDVRLRSELSPTNRLLRAMSVFARPIARFGHDWVLDTGARQFRARAL
jgi:uncharacterized protein YndB with AHSA1/START domain